MGEGQRRLRTLPQNADRGGKSVQTHIEASAVIGGAGPHINAGGGRGLQHLAELQGGLAVLHLGDETPSYADQIGKGLLRQPALLPRLAHQTPEVAGGYNSGRTIAGTLRRRRGPGTG